MRARGGINFARNFLILIGILTRRSVDAARDDFGVEDKLGSDESSDAYLRNVVSELQFLNGVAPSVDAPHQEASLAVALAEPVIRQQQQRLMEQRLAERNRAAQFSLQKYARPQLAAADPSTSYLDQDVGETVPVHHYHHQQVHSSVPQAPNILGMSASELASMYKAALDRGNPMRYSSLMATGGAPAPQQLHHQRQLTKLMLQPEQQPQAALVYAGANARPPTTQTARPGYAYYFYPLDSFRHELADPYGYKTLPSISYDLAPAATTTEPKETSVMSRVAKGVSSFVGMIVAFMLSLFLYPRFMQYLHLPVVTTTSRAAFQNELTHLVSFVTEAIDYYNKHLRKKSRRSIHTLKRSR